MRFLVSEVPLKDDALNEGSDVAVANEVSISLSLSLSLSLPVALSLSLSLSPCLSLYLSFSAARRQGRCRSSVEGRGGGIFFEKSQNLNLKVLVTRLERGHPHEENAPKTGLEVVRKRSKMFF